MTPQSGRKTKLLAAVVGGSAVLAMGAFTVSLHETPSLSVPAAKANTMQIGSTATTTTTPPGMEATPMAVPTIKGPAPLPSEQQAAE
ncbi:MAG: hypothetical protein JST91_05940 [Actinobacteria bacterium]|nr:hypothetical protein [Actinomycetota bacterium]MBS1900298.1 hypothetical protein [Actinomycetota bacterium]